MDKPTKVFFTASYYGKKKYQRYYDLVLKKIEENDVEVIGTEKGNYMKLLNRDIKGPIFHKKKLHYEAIRKGILWCDASIFENSHEDFQLGHEATLAIQAKKTVLCLSIHEDFSKKIDNEFFHGAKYNEYNIGKVIRDFLDIVRKEKLSERFNCFLSKRQYAYLGKVAWEEKMNKSKYLRRLIDRDMKGER